MGESSWQQVVSTLSMLSVAFLDYVRLQYCFFCSIKKYVLMVEMGFGPNNPENRQLDTLL